jgi:hypothetical protein
MIGESQLKRFMQSVETVTEHLAKADPLVEEQRRREEDLAEKAEDMKETADVQANEEAPAWDRKGLDALGNLLVNGAQFLMSIGNAIMQPPEAGKQPATALHAMIGRDESTGETYLKIPLPETEVMGNLLSTLGEIITQSLQKKT